MFSKIIKTKNFYIGGDNPSYLIAEAGVSHFGDFDSAIKLLDMSISARVNAFKVQLFNVDNLFKKSEVFWKDRLKNRNLTLNQFKDLKAICKKNSIDFIATAHDESMIPWLIDLDVDCIKIGSGEKNNISFIKKLAEIGKPLIISTGMYSEEDVKEVITSTQDVGCKDLCILHCNTSYPTPYEDVNLRAIKTLEKLFNGPVGYSDHTDSFLASYGALTLGAKLIEKHITLKKNIPNAQDWKVSADPSNIDSFVKNIRSIEKMFGNGIKKSTKSEKDALIWAQKSLVAKKDLSKNHLLDANDLIAKRPGGGIKPNKKSLFIGKKLICDIKEDENITFDHI